MNCDERSDLLLFRSVARLTGPEDAVLQRSLAEECPPLDLVQGEVDATLALIGQGLVPLPTSSAARSAFLGRLANHSRASTTASASASALMPALAPSEPDPRQRAVPWAWVLSVGIPPVIALAVVTSLYLQKDALALELQDRLRESDQTLTDIRQSVDGKTQEVAKQITVLEKLLTGAEEQLKAHQQDFSKAEAALTVAQGTVEQFKNQTHALSLQIAELTKEHQELITTSQRASELIALLPNPHVRLIDLAGTRHQPGATGCVLNDPDHAAWHLITINLAPLPLNQGYQLWFVTSDHQRISGGVFTPDAKGTASIVAQLPANAGQISSFEVTDEPLAGSSAPTGAIQLLSAP